MRVDRRNADAVRGELVEILRDLGGWRRTSEVWLELGWYVSYGAVWRLLSELAGIGAIERRQERPRCTVYWRAPDEDEPLTLPAGWTRELVPA